MNFSILRVCLNSVKVRNKCPISSQVNLYSTEVTKEVADKVENLESSKHVENLITGNSAILHSTEKHLNEFSEPRQAWVEGFDTIEEKHYGFVNLHPEVFGKIPRLDIIKFNIEWQKKYKWVSYVHTKVTNEVERTGKKPWPQKGTGRARHGSKRGPLWLGGSRAHGPRDPKTHFFMMSFYERILGLTSTLSIKHMQDDLHIVKDLKLPVEDPQYLEELVEERCWGPSVLFVDTTDLIERNIAIVTDQIKHYNVMPAYGLNVHTMLKHDTLVLTIDAVKHIEEKILYALHRSDNEKMVRKFQLDQQ